MCKSQNGKLGNGMRAMRGMGLGCRESTYVGNLGGTTENAGNHCGDTGNHGVDLGTAVEMA